MRHMPIKRFPALPSLLWYKPSMQSGFRPAFQAGCMQSGRSLPIDTVVQVLQPPGSRENKWRQQALPLAPLAQSEP